MIYLVNINYTDMAIKVKLKYLLGLFVVILLAFLGVSILSVRQVDKQDTQSGVIWGSEYTIRYDPNLWSSVKTDINDRQVSYALQPLASSAFPLTVAIEKTNEVGKYFPVQKAANDFLDNQIGITEVNLSEDQTYQEVPLALIDYIDGSGNQLRLVMLSTDSMLITATYAGDMDEGNQQILEIAKNLELHY